MKGLKKLQGLTAKTLQMDSSLVIIYLPVKLPLALPSQNARGTSSFGSFSSFVLVLVSESEMVYISAFRFLETSFSSVSISWKWLYKCAKYGPMQVASLQTPNALIYLDTVFSTTSPQSGVGVVGLVMAIQA
ncbi:hypothetical protein R1flu_016744 [Riccia fluitans]|uniref:Uncharacterized protein n=1 Tax=Riccia fluitans TaxID=41844 RepID=A0ABD1YMQ7_9MARC